MIAVSKHRSVAGFTLVELLIALTILGFIAAALFAALRFSSRAWDSGADRLAQAAAEDAGRSFLRGRLEAVAPATLPGESQIGESAFVGEPDRVRFAAPMPSEVGIGGLYLFTLESDVAGALLLDWQLLRPEGPVDVADGRARPRELFPAAGRASFRYFGRPEGIGTGDWYRYWESAFLPDVVEIRFEPDTDGAVPAIRAALSLQ